MMWPIVCLVCCGMVLGTGIYLAHLWLMPKESARNAELLRKVASLEAKAKALEGRTDVPKVAYPFHMGQR